MDVLFKTVNLHLVVNSSIVNKVAKLWYLAVLNLVKNSAINSQFISVNFLLHDKCFIFVRVYGANTYSVRRLFWRDLSYFTCPWCILRDFNIVLSIVDCKGRVAPN